MKSFIELSQMKNVELKNYLINYKNDKIIKVIVQYVVCPFSRVFTKDELKYAQPLNENINGQVNYKENEDKQKQSIAIIIQQIKNVGADNILSFIEKSSAKLNSVYQNYLTDILTKNIKFDITAEELKTIYPDSNIFKLPKIIDINSVKGLLPLRGLVLSNNFKRLLSYVCVNYVKYFDDQGKELKTDTFSKDFVNFAGQIPMVFDGYFNGTYYLLTDCLIFGHFKRGKTSFAYTKRLERLQNDIKEFHSDKKVGNKNIMVPKMFEIDNEDTYQALVNKLTDKGNLVMKQVNDNYQTIYRTCYNAKH